MKTLRKLILPVLIAAVSLLAVRGLLLTHMRMEGADAPAGMQPGSHVLVSLTWYGLRLPGESLWGYHRVGYRVPAEGDPLVFTLPDEQTAAGTCRAVPGDTVWTDPVRRLILPARTSPDAQPFIVPGRGRSVAVTPANAHLLCRLMRRYEGSQVRIDQHARLWLKGTELRRVRPTRDYYWIETRPDHYALVPHSALVGKIVTTLKLKKK